MLAETLHSPLQRWLREESCGRTTFTVPLWVVIEAVTSADRTAEHREEAKARQARYRETHKRTP